MMARRLLLLAAAASLAATLLLPGPATALQVGDTCSADAACGSGLHCSACGPGGGGICTRAAPIDPATHGTGLPFNNYSWLTTHNSFALAGAVSAATGQAVITQTNQEDTVTAQLKVTNRFFLLLLLLPVRLRRGPRRNRGVVGCLAILVVWDGIPACPW